ncbi:hypothetical protein FB550_10334 [Neobacillus bataviensis]|uniref:Fur-regulated basic protein A n=1 Tax=Neobacillus bataviensis TaxID=220685 RepID=A0A561DND2_9BACI|nr:MULTISPECIES: hypothetical protein [Bacillaceae]MCM3726200.1 hypothetical protein [Neobacillus cucumis]TWE04860.1 hypothetical protein FB550_10334 [Neobacillus bataviensis]
MTTHLRRGLERLKQFYIKKLAGSDMLYSSAELQSLTISELEILYKKSMPSKK